MHRLHTQVDWIQLFYPFLRDLSAEGVLFVDDKHMDNTGIVLDHFVYCCLATRIIVLRASRLFVYQWNIFTPGVHCREEEVTVYHSGRIRLHAGFFFSSCVQGQAKPWAVALCVQGCRVSHQHLGPGYKDSLRPPMIVLHRGDFKNSRCTSSQSAAL